MIIAELAAASPNDGAFDLKTLLMFIGGAVLLAFFSSIGLIARIRERRIEDRKFAAKNAANNADHPAIDGGQDSTGPTPPGQRSP